MHALVLCVLIAALFSCGSSDESRYAQLTLIPQPLALCPGELGKLEVVWFIESWRLVEVRLNGPSGQLFAQSTSRGHQETGNWVEPGQKFVLVDARTGQVLTSATVQTTVPPTCRTGSQDASAGENSTR